MRNIKIVKQIKIVFFTVLYFTTWYIAQAQSDTQPRLLIKLPTRSRPEKFFKVLDLYYQKLSGTIPYQFLISGDVDDKSMNCAQVIDHLKTYSNLNFYFSESDGKIEAVNRDIEKHLDFDILLVASDDMIPVADGYDRIIADKMRAHFPDFDGTLNLYDGHCGAELNTIPIMGKKYYERFGYVYYPDYKSVCCDLEFTLVAELLNKNTVCNDLILRHDHPAYGAPTDELYQLNESNEFFVHDKKLLQQRKAINFGLAYQEIASEKLPTSLDLFGPYDRQKITWSILICTLKSRQEQFTQLYRTLLEQIEQCNLHHEVEILFFLDDRNCSVGNKRNRLLQEAHGKYICFVDDDDEVHPQYVKMIHEKLKENPDCVNLVGVISQPQQKDKVFIHSIKYDSFFEKKGIYYRPPNHLNPIRRDIAIQFKFPEKNFSEDSDWAMSICASGLLKKEAKINQAYYHYRFDPQTSQATAFVWSIILLNGENKEWLELISLKLNKQIWQHHLTSHIEILIFDDNTFHEHSAIKLNQLLTSAHGTYVSFLDEHTDVYDDYLKSVFDILEQEKPDYVAMQGVTFASTTPKKFINDVTNHNNYYESGIWHYPITYSCPIRTKIAQQFAFDIISDTQEVWIKNIIKSGLLKKGASVNLPLMMIS